MPQKLIRRGDAVGQRRHVVIPRSARNDNMLRLKIKVAVTEAA